MTKLNLSEVIKNIDPNTIRYNSNGIILICDDCRNVMPSLEPVQLVLTDPPYGVGIKYSEKYNDDPVGYWDWFLPTIDAMRMTGQIVIFTHRNVALQHIIGYDWVGVWNKPGSFGARIGNSPILPHWEPIFFYGIHKVGVMGDCLPDVITCNPEKSGGTSLIGREKWQNDGFTYHPCVKPISLIKKLILPFTREGDIVLDPFSGSGTTLVAAQELGRQGIGIEIEERFIELAINRLNQAVLPLGFH